MPQGPRLPTSITSNWRKSVAEEMRASGGAIWIAKPIHLSPHLLRKANATWQAMRGVAPTVLQSMLGHAPGSKVTDKHYIQVEEAAVRHSIFELEIGSGAAAEIVW